LSNNVAPDFFAAGHLGKSGMSLTFTAVAPFGEIPKGGNKAYKVSGHDILICLAGDEVYAVANLCSHQQAALEGGTMRGCFLFCPLHGVRYDLRDGTTKAKLAKGPIATYPTRVENGIIEVALEPGS
jgi:3-phenylpropionate/trans-cinnamate dioxygenase ferredoxin subunit